MIELQLVAVVNIIFSPFPDPLSAGQGLGGREPFMQRPRDAEEKKTMTLSNPGRFHEGEGGRLRDTTGQG